METAKRDEWAVIESLLPEGWQDAARSEGAFRRARYTQTASELLRLLLFHATSDTPLRETMELAQAAKISSLSPVALFKRMKSAPGWLTWLCRGLANEFRELKTASKGFRLRVVDGTTVQGPAARKIDWRLHFSIDLMSLSCDWFELTGVEAGEALWRVPMQRGDVLLADRYYLTPRALQATVAAGAFMVVRLRWNHSRMERGGKKVTALQLCRRLRVGEVGEWDVTMPLEGGGSSAGRVIATRLPAPLAARAERKIRGAATHKKKRLDTRSVKATRYVMVFTTLPAARADAAAVLQLYRARWQIELVFKRMKQLLKLGQLPHKNRLTGQTWILSKLLLSLLLEKLYRQAGAFSPWGYDLEKVGKAA